MITQKGRFYKLVSSIDVWTVLELLIIFSNYSY